MLCRYLVPKAVRDIKITMDFYLALVIIKAPTSKFKEHVRGLSTF